MSDLSLKLPSFHRLHYQIQHNLWRMPEDCFGRICQCAYDLLFTDSTSKPRSINTDSNNWWKIIHNCYINVHKGCVCYLLFSVCGASQARNALTIQWRAFYRLTVSVLSQMHDGECVGVRLMITHTAGNILSFVVLMDVLCALFFKSWTCTVYIPFVF